MKLAIVTTHPIQYNAPWFKMLAAEPGIEVKVFYTWEQSQQAAKYDPGFGKQIEWDIPLLDGYEYTFVKNTSKDPGSHHYKGIVNPNLNKEIEGWGAKAVLVFGWPFKSHLSCMKFFKGKIPVLFRGDSTLLDEQGALKFFIKKQILRYVYSHIDYALYVGSNSKAYFKEYGIKEHQLVFVPHAIDNERFKAGNVNIAELEKLKGKLGIKDDTFVILFAGKFIPKKDPFFMLRLAEELDGENYRFILVGNGELEEELKASAMKDNRIKFLGFQNQTKMPLIYSMSDMYVLPSKGPNETWGLAINEAMASNNFIITTSKVGCAVDLVKNNRNGIIVEPGDAKTAAGYITGVSGDTAAKTVAEQVNTELLRTFSYQALVKNTKELLYKIG